jgi:hypothetical protein
MQLDLDLDLGGEIERPRSLWAIMTANAPHRQTPHIGKVNVYALLLDVIARFVKQRVIRLRG